MFIWALVLEDSPFFNIRRDPYPFTIVFKNYTLTLLKANPQCSHVSYSNEMKLRLFKFTLKFKPMIENKDREYKEMELLRQKRHYLF